MVSTPVFSCYIIVLCFTYSGKNDLIKPFTGIFRVFLHLFLLHYFLKACIYVLICDFLQPLMARKTELDKLRKDLKEQWQREQKKMVGNHLSYLDQIRSVGSLPL